jgi:hypothetical protein
MNPPTLTDKRDNKRIELIMAIIDNSRIPTAALEVAEMVIEDASRGVLRETDLVELVRLLVKAENKYQGGH